MPSLLIIDRQNERTEIEITLPFFTIGRSSACTVQIEDHGLSKRHARLYQTPEGYCVIDAGSKNGVVVNGQKVERALLRAGDHIRLGGVSIYWNSAGLAPAEASGDPATSTAVAESLVEQFGTDRYAHYTGPLRLKPGEVDLDAPSDEPATPTADPAPLELADPYPTPPPATPPPVRGPAPVAGLASTERVAAAPRAAERSVREPPLGALHLKGVPSRARAAPGDALPTLPPAPQVPLPPLPATARMGIAPPEAGPVLDEVDRALARLASERDADVAEPSLRSFAALALGQARAGVRAIGPRAIALATVCAVGLVAMIVHARSVIDARWHEGPAVAVVPADEAGTDEELAAQMFREADGLRASRPDLADALLARLVRTYPDSGWADLARVRLVRPGGGSGQGSGAPDAVERALEQAYAAGRAGEAIEGYARLVAAARAVGNDATAARLSERLTAIEREVLAGFDGAAKELPVLAEAGEVEALARRAAELLVAYPLPEVRRRLDELLATAARPTPPRLCRRLVGLLLREDSPAATRLLEAAAAERDLTGVSAEIARLGDLVLAQRRYLEAADSTLRARPLPAPPELGLVAGTVVAGWGAGGLVVRDAGGERELPFSDIAAALRYALLKQVAPKAAVAGDLAAYALLRDLGPAYDEALAAAKKADRAFAQRAAWIAPLAEWYRRMLR